MRIRERMFHIIFAPRSECSRERKYQGAKVPVSESFRERKFQGAKVPPMVLSLLGAKVRGNESSSYLGLLLGTASTAVYLLVSVEICSSVIGVISRPFAALIRHFDTCRRFVTSHQAAVSDERRRSANLFLIEFPVATARVWNSLPELVTSAPSVAVFRSRLKTHRSVLPHQTHFTNTQDLYLAPVRTVRPVRCFVTSVPVQ